MSRPTLHLVEKFGLTTICGVLNALGRMLQEGEPPYSSGICGNISIHLGIESRTATELVGCVASTWPEYSGVHDYPVPGWDGRGAAYAYGCAKAEQMWSHDHEYGQARWRLVHFMVEQLAHELVEYDKAPWPAYR